MGMRAATLRVLQRQSVSTAWIALQQSALGLLLVDPGTTKGAHTFRLVSSEAHEPLWASAVWVCTSTSPIKTTKSSAAAWKLMIIDLKAAMSI